MIQRWFARFGDPCSADLDLVVNFGFDLGDRLGFSRQMLAHLLHGAVLFHGIHVTELIEFGLDALLIRTGELSQQHAMGARGQ